MRYLRLIRTLDQAWSSMLENVAIESGGMARLTGIAAGYMQRACSSVFTLCPVPIQTLSPQAWLPTTGRAVHGRNMHQQLTAYMQGAHTALYCRLYVRTWQVCLHQEHRWLFIPSTPTTCKSLPWSWAHISMPCHSERRGAEMQS